MYIERVKRTIYVKEEDGPLFDRASAEGNLSQLIATLLRGHYDEIDEGVGSLPLQKLPVGYKVISFRGEQIWPPDERQLHGHAGYLLSRADPLGDLDGNTEMSSSTLYFTAKRKFLVHMLDRVNDEYTYRVYSGLSELLEAYAIDQTSGLASYLRYAAGNPEEIELDI